MSVVVMSHFNASAVADRTDYFCGESDERQDTEGVGTGGAEDYYVGAVDDLGGAQWIGAGARSLGLSGRGVTREDFGSIFSGCDPESGERLRQGSPNGQERAGYEMAFNVDKSVSALYAIVDSDAKEQLEKAILKAHDATIDHVSKQGYFKTRRGRDGAVSESTENIVAARFLHGTNRNQDPHLHVHCEIASIVQNETGGWTTLDAVELYRRQSEIRYLFDVSLANNLRELGLSLGENDAGVTVRGIDEQLLGQWSSRRREILEKLEKIGATGPGNREANMAVTISSRARKDEALIRDSLFERWQESAKAFGYDASFIDEQKNIGDQFRERVMSEEVEADLLNNRSVFMARDFDRVAARFTVGRGGLDDLQKTRSDLIHSLNIVRLTDDFYTTARVAECEMAVMRSALGRQGEVYHRIPEREIGEKISEIEKKEIEKAKAEGRYNPEKDYGLNLEQNLALAHIAGETGGMAILEGAAGTGKSFTMRPMRELYESSGFSVRGLAPSGKAAAELESGSGIESQTVHRFLMALEDERETLSANDVLVLDEAGMTDSVTLARLVNHCHVSGAKLILSGDSNQLEAIGTANLLRDIGKEIGSAELLQIARQKDPARKAISQSFFEAKGGSAVTAMSSQGLIIQTRQGDDHLRQAVTQYLGNCEGRHPSESLLLADSREQVARLNDLVRQARIERGDLNPYEAEKVSLRGDDDRAHEEVLMPGDRLMFRRNDRELGVTNGTTGTLVSVMEGSLVIQLDGEKGSLKEVDLSEYDRLDVAYAMTVHKSQGMTVDKAVYVTSDRTSNRSAYVAYTRAREGAQFVTPESLENLGKQCDDRREKTTTINAYDVEGGPNLMMDNLRQQASASKAIADLEGSDLLATVHVLDDQYRAGTRENLENRYRGQEIALTTENRNTVEHLSEFEQVLAQVREPVKDEDRSDDRFNSEGEPLPEREEESGSFDLEELPEPEPEPEESDDGPSFG